MALSARWFERTIVGGCLLALQIIAYYSALDHLGHVEPRVGLMVFGLTLSIGAGGTLLVFLILAVHSRIVHVGPIVGGLVYGAVVGTFAVVARWPLVEAFAFDSDLGPLLIVWVLSEYALLGVPLLLFLLIGSILQATERGPGRRRRIARGLYAAAPSAVMALYLALAVGTAIQAPAFVEQVPSAYEETPGPGWIMALLILGATAWTRRRSRG